jgi:23S rRNA (cytidine1920-2'-O)/16S rRNA (cytidine1409-2'-O)-methyltransferase
MRLDQYISQKLWVSRNKAQFFIEQEKVKVNSKIITKLSYLVKETDKVEENIQEINYVSRSALKLKWFLEENNIELIDMVCLDIGSSTGWFTQVLLEKWVKKVYALDVGTSQLHETLKGNSKIVSIENTDIRKFDKNIIKEEINLIVCDISFISLTLIIDSILELMSKQTKAILLFKPQFEVWSENLTKMWVPKSEKVIKEKFDNFCLILKEKWVKIQLIKESSLPWENWNKEIFVFTKKLWL